MIRIAISAIFILVVNVILTVTVFFIKGVTMVWTIIGIEVGLILGLGIAILVITGIENDWFVE